MTDRYFKNFMSDFVQEKATVPGIDEDKQEDSLLKLLALPYPTLSEKLKRAALDLKETIVVKTWGFTGQDIKDFSLYRGSLGTAFLLLKSYQVTNNKNDLDLASEIIKACDSSSSSSRVVSFLLGRVGVCALGAVVAKHQGNEEMVDYYLTQFKEIKLSEDVLDEVIFGRAGYLSACLFLNKNLGHETIPSSHTVSLPFSIALTFSFSNTDNLLNQKGVVIDKMIENGRKLGSKGKCPLMFEYKGERQWGVAHGLAGILNVLMHFELKSDVVLDVKETLKYMIKNRFPSGNYPKQEDMKSDLLVYWCHGASGVALTLVKAAEVFEDKEFLEAAIDASKVVWDRGLLKKVGICHGISGNAYVFLSLYKMTGSVEFLHKAKAFACFLLDKSHKLISEGEMHGGDNPYSLFEGIGGMAYLFLDMTDPTNAKFPTHEV